MTARFEGELLMRAQTSNISSSAFSCRSDRVQAYFDATLDAAEYALVERHMDVCGICAEELRSLRQLYLLVVLAFNGEQQQQLSTRVRSS